MLPESESVVRIAPAEKLEASVPVVAEPSEPARRMQEMRDHPDFRSLECFMRGELSGPGRRTIVRHLLAGCPQCVEITRRFWAFGDS